MLGASAASARDSIDKKSAKLNEKFVVIRDKYNKITAKSGNAGKSALQRKNTYVQGRVAQVDPAVAYAYVVFRSMDGARLCEHAYSRYGRVKRCCIAENACNKGRCLKARKDFQSKHIFKLWPVINRACTPDNIKWEHLGYSRGSRRWRGCCTWGVALLLILLSVVGVILMKNETVRLKAQFNSNVVCPADSSSAAFKKAAWDDQQDPVDRIRLMHCYCL